ncbi:TetR/AcrR family transcriptional regulator [Yinghuangia seranimata]|uniref:TetR/AcrR family transcriptional regulator n=1 Tax=Yinghuangia seranimata TaxID=408067 RepID=UPI00248B1298|nr:TetR/AcrR family transcriptional regulator [Yinghuangia seranimata]MDI2124945.1 TetR/AcrR family transcriptional regulator [Yinghuangia seranimata]
MDAPLTPAPRTPASRTAAPSPRAAAPTGRYADRPAEDRRAERRRRLLAAGLEPFGGRTVHRAATIAALCAEAGLSTRRFYEEFASLEGVLTTLYRDAHAEAEQAAAEALAAVVAGPGLPPARELAGVVLRVYVEVSARDPRIARLLYVEVVGVNPELEAERRDRRTRWVDLLLDIADAYADLDRPAGEHPVAVYAFVGAVNGLAHDWCLGLVEATLDDVVAEPTNLLAAALRIP